MSLDRSITVRDNPAQRRYEVFVGDEPAGFAAYRTRPDRVVFVHTEIDDRFVGQGVGGTLARAALDDVRRQGKRVTPLCPFIAGYIRRHPAYADLVDERHRATHA